MQVSEASQPATTTTTTTTTHTNGDGDSTPAYACLKGEAFEVRLSQLLAIVGRGPAADIDFGDADHSISRRHARLEYNWTRQVFEVTALGKNGLVINADRFTSSDGPQTLRHRDVVHLTLNICFCFVLPPNVAARPPLPLASPSKPTTVPTTSTSVSMASPGGTKLKISLGKRKAPDTPESESSASKRSKPSPPASGSK